MEPSRTPWRMVHVMQATERDAVRVGNRGVKVRKELRPRGEGTPRTAAEFDEV